jgi:hypothetical protein
LLLSIVLLIYILVGTIRESSPLRGSSTGYRLGFEDIIAISAFTIGLEVVDGLLLCLDHGQ